MQHRRRRPFLPLFLLLLLVVSLSLIAAPPPPADGVALLAFKSKADLAGRLRFSPSSPAAFCVWPGVKCVRGRAAYVILSNVPLGGVIYPGTLTRLDQLRVLSLHNDSLAGPLPDLSGLLSLKLLFLDHNSFTGRLTPSLASLPRLRTVDLSSNAFAGALPPSLASLRRLRYLRLDRNRFTGAIPPLNQTSLVYFNASGNGLSGPVPVTAVLRRFGAASFSANPGLCGEIVSRVCASRQPFFESSASSPAARPAAARGLSPRSGGYGRAGAVAGLSVGVVFLAASLGCLALAVRRQKGGRRRAVTEAMSSDAAAAAEAEAVMRIEEADELGEKVKRAQVGQGGSLVFCAGEAQAFSVEELMRASAELLGRGTMGTTYKAVLDDRVPVCVKRLDATGSAAAAGEAFERHMECVGSLRHPNLVPLRAYFHGKQERLLIYDYQPNGSLFSLIHGSRSASAKPLHWTSCLKIAEDVAQGLCYIHQAWRLVHGNLKSSNVLLGADFEACITDYCLAALAPPSAAADDGDADSAGYRAPEIRRPDRPCSGTPGSDVYSFGVLLVVLLTGKPPSEHPKNLRPENVMGWVGCVRREGQEGEAGKMGMVLEVAMACTVGLPEQRPTMWQVLRMIQEIKEAALMA